MKIDKRFDAPFEKISLHSPESVKAVCDKLQATSKTEYDIRSNGNHIWVELGQKKQHFWSPMLHLRIEHANNQTFIRGEFAENPLLWTVFLIIQIGSIALFLLALMVAGIKYHGGQNFNLQLLAMFAMISVWLALHLISERFKRKGMQQREALHDFVEAIAAT